MIQIQANPEEQPIYSGPQPYLPRARISRNQQLDVLCLVSVLFNINMAEYSWSWYGLIQGQEIMSVSILKYIQHASLSPDFSFALAVSA